MIPSTRTSRKPSTWQRELARAFTEPAELIRELRLDPALLSGARTGSSLFSLRVPTGYVARMRVGDPDDPLLRQVLPLDTEAEDAPGFTSDPIDDLASHRAGGVLQKYHGRVLLLTTGACGVHCRYCFRRHFPYHDALAVRSRWRAAVDHIRGDRTIHEVILSGGDPLSLTDAKLRELSTQLGDVPHVHTLRIHTRQPIVLPERIDESFIDWLSSIRKKVVIVLHANHANEIDERVRTATRELARCGAALLNQSVLLKGVNDDVDALVKLSEALFHAGVMPYYLHLLDRVRGAAHFEVDESVAIELMGHVSSRLPGYLVPRLAREVPGAAAKAQISTVTPSTFPPEG